MHAGNMFNAPLLIDLHRLPEDPSRLRTTSRSRSAESHGLVRSTQLDAQLLRHRNEPLTSIAGSDPQINPAFLARLLYLILTPILLTRTFDVDSLQSVLLRSLKIVEMRSHHDTFVRR